MMSMILEKSAILAMNQQMLYNGYSYIDAEKMSQFSGRSDITTKQAWFILLTLKKYNSTHLIKYAADIEESTKFYGGDTTPSQPQKTKVKNCRLQVKRSSTEVDMLDIKMEYHPQIVDALHQTGGLWDNRAKTWKIYIENAVKLYQHIQPICDNKELKKWAELVNSWHQSYPLINYQELPLKFQPYNFQPQDAAKLLELRLGLNANEVGCGKTFEMVLVGESLPMKKLVICPASLRLNWEREIKMVNPQASVHIQYNDQPFQTDDWTIIGYPSLKKFLTQLENQNFQCVMIDEAHYIQAVNNWGKPTSQRAEAVLRIAATAAYVFPITGTPKTSRNKNLYNILRLLRHPLTRGHYAFHRYGVQYCDYHQTNWGADYNGNSNDAELNQILQPIMIRHLKKDVLPHLKKQRQTIPVSISLVKYNRLISDYLEQRQYPNSEGKQLVILNKAKQVVAIQKAEESIEFAKNFVDNDESVVIATCYTEVVNKVLKAFPGKVEKIVGGMTDTQKQTAIDNFQAGKSRVMVINYEAGGVGITLTTAAVMILNDLPWVTGAVEQAEGRIWRAGQSSNVMIYFMVATNCPMDEILVDTIVYKSATINAAVDGGLGMEIDLRRMLDKFL